METNGHDLTDTPPPTEEELHLFSCHTNSHSWRLAYAALATAVLAWPGDDDERLQQITAARHDAEWNSIYWNYRQDHDERESVRLTDLAMQPLDPWTPPTDEAPF